MTVGVSGRTPAKHAVMNRVMGQQIGILARVPRVGRQLGVNGWRIVDATAGDAADDQSSPMLAKKHAAWGLANGLQVTVDLIERDPSTFNQLAASAVGSCSYIYLHHADARELVPSLNRDGKAVLLVDDPNNSGGSVLTEEVIAWAFSEPATTVFSSIGANASGVARRNGHYEESLARYFSLLDAAESERKFRRETIFCRLTGDPHRWAYLVVGSDRFAEDIAHELTKAMRWVPAEHGRYALSLRGEVCLGFDAVRQALSELHGRRTAEMPEQTELSWK